VLIPIGTAVGLLVLFVASGFRIVREFERGVVLRLGSYTGEPRGPGLIWIIPVIDRMFKVDLRVVARDVPPQDVITRDNVSVKVNAVIYFRVVKPDLAVLKVENYLYATSQYAQTTLRAILGQVELDDLLSERDRINQQLQEVIDRHTDPWGVKVTSVEVKHVDLPSEMQRAMARQAEAERYRRAKVIAAEGEFQAADRLSDAAQIIATAPGAITLRYLQTLQEIAVENNSTTVFPIPIDLLRGMQKITGAGSGESPPLDPDEAKRMKEEARRGSASVRQQARDDAADAPEIPGGPDVPRSRRTDAGSDEGTDEPE
jgi:regulator of protease activity HflC (stomatin/prohibitin superfamily)